MTDSTPTCTPMDERETLYPAEDDELLPPAEHAFFRKNAGLIQYIVIWTSADLAYAMSVLAKYVNRPGWHDLAALKRILRYLAGTVDFSISWTRSLHLKNIVYGYVEASWADCPITRRSVTGFILYLNGGPIAWRCQKQSLVAFSSLEAEYYAASKCICEVMDLRHIMREIFLNSQVDPFGKVSRDFRWSPFVDGEPEDEPTVLFEDNSGTIATAVNPMKSERTKHIDMRMHFCRDKVRGGFVVLAYCPTAEMLADILTKALGPQVFLLLRDFLARLSPLRTGVDEKRIWNALRASHCNHRERVQEERAEDLSRLRRSIE